MNKQAGFTLIELMIVVAILGILSTVGMMSYGTYSSKGERDRGCVMILPEMARDLETYRQVNTSYTTSFTTLNSVLRTSKEWSATPTDSTLKHTYSIAAGSSGDISTSFKISCTPTEVGADGFDKTGCGVLTYDNFGRKGATKEASKTIDSCWR
ncbi:hypothetical protein MNBD_GAMMA11-3223 [hydrothermal vent metagenome]|uniref:Type IV pilus biogenesis protein PilE n=1 Tax=hydrothermal vent metagenome TaxID=652676 RepID=A0A3B0WQV0_9ZZZZ